jgi:hypothetical protein
MKSFQNIFREIYGDNAVVGFSYFIASRFKEVIIEQQGYFPILNIINTEGKPTMEISLLVLNQKADCWISMKEKPKEGWEEQILSREIVFIPEYENTIEDENFLKKFTLNNAIILTSSEPLNNKLSLPILYLPMPKIRFSMEHWRKFRQLRACEDSWDHRTGDLIKEQTSYFQTHYMENYETVIREIKNLIGAKNYEFKILQDWSIILAAIKTLNKRMPFIADLPDPTITDNADKFKEQFPTIIDSAYKYEDCLQIFANGVIRQSNEMKQTEILNNNKEEKE